MAAVSQNCDARDPPRRRLSIFHRPSLKVLPQKNATNQHARSDPVIRQEGLQKKDRNSSWLSQWSSKSNDVDTEKRSFDSERGTLYSLDTSFNPRDRAASPVKLSPIDSRSSLDRQSRLLAKAARLNVNSRKSTERALEARRIGLDHTSIVHHGEIRSKNPKGKKAREHLVLSENALLRFKTQTDALLAFSESLRGRSVQNSHSTSPIPASPPEAHQSVTVDVVSTSKGQGYVGLALSEIIAIDKTHEVEAPPSLVIHYITAESQQSQVWHLHLSTVTERDSWAAVITRTTRSLLHRNYAFSTVHTAREDHQFPALEDSAGLSSFTCIQHFDPENGVRSPASGKKNSSATVTLAVDEDYLHLTSIHGGYTTSIGFATVMSVETSTSDGVIIQSKLPFSGSRTWDLASIRSSDIASLLNHRLQALRPGWLSSPVTTLNQTVLLDEAGADPNYESIYPDQFVKVLGTYLRAYQQDIRDVNYSITGLPGSLQFQLLPRSVGTYGRFELLAILRSMYFLDLQSASFAGISLDGLDISDDRAEIQHFEAVDRHLSKTGSAVLANAPTSVLAREIYCMIATNPGLVQLDISRCLMGTSASIGCGREIFEALYPLFTSGVTSLHWLSMAGNRIPKEDLQYLYLIADESKVELHGLDLSGTGLNQHDVTQLLNALQEQGETLEYLNLSNNGACLNQCSFDSLMGRFAEIQSLDLSNLTLSMEIGDPLLSASTLSNWHLRDLNMNDTFVSQATVEALCAYLRLPQSHGMTSLHIEDCNLSGEQIALIMEAAAHGFKQPRPMALFVGRNHPSIGHKALAHAIKYSKCTNMLSLDRSEYLEQDDLQDLIDAVKANNVIESLSLSRIRLLASPYSGTNLCRAIETCFAENKRLLDVDLSGSSTDLNTSEEEIPSGIRSALKGLRRCHNLRTLNVDFQSLGSDGARLLASVITANPDLSELYCEQTSVTLEGIEAIIDALRSHYSLTYVSDMEDSKIADLEEVGEGSRRHVTKLESPPNKAMQVFTGFEGKLAARRSHRRSRRSTTNARLPMSRSSSDDDTARRWEEKQTLLFEFLERNRRIACGEIDKAAFLDGAEGQVWLATQEMAEEDEEDNDQTRRESEDGSLEVPTPSTITLATPFNEALFSPWSGAGAKGR